MVVGIISLLAFFPIFMLDELNTLKIQPLHTTNPILEFWNTVRQAMKTPVLWFAGSIEMLVYLATYAIKSFLPLYVHMELGFDLLTIGIFFSLQEAGNLFSRPFGGMLADRFGLRLVLAFALSTLSACIYLLLFATTEFELALVAIVMGISLGVTLPTITAFYSLELEDSYLGLGMGLLGTIRNTGKVVGPIGGGLMLSITSYPIFFATCSFLIFSLAVVLLFNWTKEVYWIKRFWSQQN